MLTICYRSSNGGGGYMGPFLATHSLPHLKREPEGVISPPARPLARNASGQASSSPPTPSLASNVSRRGFLMLCPSPRPIRERAGLLLAPTPSLASNTSRRGFLMTWPSRRPKRERAGFSPPILSPHKRERAYSWPPTLPSPQTRARGFILLYYYCICFYYNCNSCTVVPYILHSLK
jgi:hypothetical protein